MKIQIKTVYDLNEKEVVAYEICPHQNIRHTATINALQPDIDIDMLCVVKRFIEQQEISDRTILFLRVSDTTLAYRENFHRWAEVMEALQAEIPIKCAAQLGHTVSDVALDQRWADLRDLGLGLSLADFGIEHAQLKRLLAHNWDFCCFDAQRTVDMVDAPALVACKNHGVRPIALDVTNQSQSVVAMLTGQNWQEGSFFSDPSKVEFFEYELGMEG